jgi:putative colanic acid biosysnthesis UDP-glucose lipid carrier transferase
MDRQTRSLSSLYEGRLGPRRRSFVPAPKSITSVVAGWLEPTVAVATYLISALLFKDHVDRADMLLCLLVFALLFPGRNRFEHVTRSVLGDILLTWAALLAGLTACGYFTDTLHYFRFDVVAAWSIATPVVLWQIVRVGRSVLRVTAAEGARSAVMVGAGALGVMAAKALRENRGQPIDVVGWFDDRAHDRLDTDAGGKLLGTLDDLAPYIIKHRIKDVYITLPMSSAPRIMALLDQLHSTTASVFYVPNVMGVPVIQGRLQDVNGIPLLGICETPFTGVNGLVKRASDIVLASIILLLISPLLLVLAIGVKLSSPGPVIFKQRRNGLDGHEIIVYKFRSMRVLQDGEVVPQATRNDPRITRFGAFIRRTSLDELPQFINVLQGRMSVVGPRPHAVAHNEQYREIIKSYMVRHKVRPGVTGWAQVNGLRGETDTLDKMAARVEYDLEYLRNWSLGLDLKIIFRTIRVVLGDHQAY